MTDRIDYLSPFRAKHRLDGRAYQDRIGRPYYGSALRRVLDPEPSRIERLSDYYHAHRWPAVVMVAFGLVVACATVAMWIVK